MVETAASGVGQFSLSSACYGKDYAQAQTAVAFLTPTSGKKIIVKQVYASSSTVTVDITLEFVTSVKTIFKL